MFFLFHLQNDYCNCHMLGVGWVKVGSSHMALLLSFHFVHLISSILLYSAKKQMSSVPSGSYPHSTLVV